MLEFTYSKWFKIGITFFLVCLIGVSIVLLFLPFYDAKMSTNALYIIAPISSCLLLLCFLGIRDLFVAKVVITDTFISSKNALFDKKLRIEEIKGYKKVEKYILIYPKGHIKKRIKISDYLADSASIHNWLHANFTDLNLQEEQKEEKEFYKSSEHRISNKEKEKLLKTAHSTAKWIKIISISTTVLALLLVKYFNNQNFIYPLVFIPLIIILIVLYFKGIIKYDKKKEDEKTFYPSVLWGFLAPIFGILLHVMFTINILNYDSVWNPLVYTTLIIFILCMYGSKEYKLENTRAIGTMISLFVFSGLYCFSILILVNVFFDTSTKQFYQAPIIEKKISKGKTTNYYFVLKDKNLTEEAEQFNVSKLVFNSKNVNDSVTIIVNEGKFNIPYYKIK